VTHSSSLFPSIACLHHSPGRALTAGLVSVVATKSGGLEAFTPSPNAEQDDNSDDSDVEGTSERKKSYESLKRALEMKQPGLKEESEARAGRSGSFQGNTRASIQFGVEAAAAGAAGASFHAEAIDRSNGRDQYVTSMASNNAPTSIDQALEGISLSALYQSSPSSSASPSPMLGFFPPSQRRRTAPAQMPFSPLVEEDFRLSDLARSDQTLLMKVADETLMRTPNGFTQIRVGSEIAVLPVEGTQAQMTESRPGSRASVSQALSQRARSSLGSRPGSRASVLYPLSEDIRGGKSGDDSRACLAGPASLEIKLQRQGEGEDEKSGARVNRPLHVADHAGGNSTGETKQGKAQKKQGLVSRRMLHEPKVVAIPKVPPNSRKVQDGWSCSDPTVGEIVNNVWSNQVNIFARHEPSFPLLSSPSNDQCIKLIFFGSTVDAPYLQPFDATKFKAELAAWHPPAKDYGRVCPFLSFSCICSSLSHCVLVYLSVCVRVFLC